MTPATLLSQALPISNTLRTGEWITSWYGDKEQGRRTANGEVFDKNKNTAAHRELPFGTKLKLSYNGRTTVVRINDRGPWIAGRQLDVSESVARYLGFHEQGIAKLLVQVLSKEGERHVLAQPSKAAKLNIQPATPRSIQE